MKKAITMNESLTHITKPVSITPSSTHCREEYQYNLARTKGPRQFGYTENWMNNLPVDLCLIYPGGKQITLKGNPNPSPNSRGITITRKYEWDKDVIFNAKDIYFDRTSGSGKWCVNDNIKDSTHPDDAFQKMLVCAENTHTTFQKKYGSISLFIDEAILEEHEFSIYVEELGVVVTIPKHVENIVHPATAEALAATQIESIGKPVAIQLFANDPSGDMYSKRYINMNGHVIPVPVIHEPGLAPGVYQSVPYDNGTDTPSFKLEFQTFSKADEVFNLYRDKEGASNHYGQVTAAVDAKMKEREAEFIEQKRLMEYEHKVRIDEYKEMAEKRKAETAQLMEELDRRKAVRNDTYDSKSTARKTWTEAIKWLPGLVTGALTAIGICFALFL